LDAPHRTHGSAVGVGDQARAPAIESRDDHVPGNRPALA